MKKQINHNFKSKSEILFENRQQLKKYSSGIFTSKKSTINFQKRRPKILVINMI